MTTALISVVMFCAGIAAVQLTQHRRNDKEIEGLFPIFIVLSRYQGVYEGGRWFAIANLDSVPESAIGEDADCANFFSTDEASLIGRGATPDAAVQDLLARWRSLDDTINLI